MASMNTAYEQLTTYDAKKVDSSYGETGISAERLCREFEKSLGHYDALDESEIARFSKYVFEGLCTGTDGDALSRADFVTGAVITDAITVQDVAMLFDVERRKGWFERVFHENVVDPEEISATSRKDVDR